MFSSAAISLLLQPCTKKHQNFKHQNFVVTAGNLDLIEA